MRLRILTDLHLEFGGPALPDVPADAVVLAGDIDLGTRGVAWARQTFPHTPVVYVPGNHEFYKRDFRTLLLRMQTAAAGSAVHVLDGGETLTLGRLRVVGATLWTDFALLGTPEYHRRVASAVMTDYEVVRVSPRYRRLTPQDTEAHHFRSRRRIEQALATPHDGPTVVVTHHAPCGRSIPASWGSDPHCPSYASALDALVERSGAALWAHGHTHTSHDYRIGNTRVVCNPRGYSGEQTNPDFDPAWVVDLPD